MSIYTARFKTGLSFNLKAQTINQAVKKAESVRYTLFLQEGDYTVYSSLGEGYQSNLSFLTLTTGYYGGYVMNINTNHKALTKLGFEIATATLKTGSKSFYLV